LIKIIRNFAQQRLGSTGGDFGSSVDSALMGEEEEMLIEELQGLLREMQQGIKSMGEKNMGKMGTSNVGIDARDANNDTALLLALRVDPALQKVAAMLLEHGADPRVQDSNGESPLHLACRWPAMDVDVVRGLLSRGADVNCASATGNTCLMRACGSGNERVVRYLVEEAKADVSAVNARGMTALFFCRRRETLQVLIGAAAKGPSGTLAGNGVSTLAKPGNGAGAEPAQFPFQLEEKEAEKGQSALLYFCTQKRGNLALCLMEAGADIFQVDFEGHTALHHAARCSLPDVCVKLIERGADVNAKRCDGLTPLLCCFKDRFDGAPARFETARALLEGGGDVNAVDKGGNTPLHYACLNDMFSASVYELLTDYGADLKKENRNRETPLLLAAATSFVYPGVLEVLLLKGSDVEHIDRRGRTALDVVADKAAAYLRQAAHCGACNGSSARVMLEQRKATSRLPETIRVLLEHGALGLRLSASHPAFAQVDAIWHNAVLSKWQCAMNGTPLPRRLLQVVKPWILLRLGRAMVRPPPRRSSRLRGGYDMRPYYILQGLPLDLVFVVMGWLLGIRMRYSSAVSRKRGRANSEGVILEGLSRC